MSYLAFFCSLVAFLLVLFLTPYYIRYLKKLGLFVKDLNKKNTPLVPLSGGLMVLGGILAGSFLYIFLRTFLFKDQSGLFLDYKNLSLLLASLCSIILITLVGFLDDIIILGNRNETSGLKQWQKPLFTLIAAVPLMAVNMGTSTIELPFFGQMNLGLIYPLILIPIGVVGASNMVNMLAGFNGLEAGLGVVYIGMLGLYAYFHASYVAALIALVALTSLLGFIYYNWYPAKILAGDSLTYLLGSIIAVIAVVGNMEKVALIAAIPFIIEFFLKLRGRFNVKSYGYFKNEKVQSHYNKIYSIPHIFTINGRFTEKQVVCFVILIELVFASLIWFV